MSGYGWTPRPHGPWRPLGLGEQPLYDVGLTLSHGSDAVRADEDLGVISTSRFRFHGPHATR
ncbi:hypothetical protein ACIHFB_19435 [Streptomyces sp. NPDC051963]|uniref:hypothetical protein n=1 Tax=Streptomyces sp. NPDC051963 TaxID=3365678 RepID=UPI0037CD8C9F